MNILVLNGPNLNLLGLREEDIYGSESLASIEEKLKNLAHESNCEIEFFQSNAEHELINSIQNAYENHVNVSKHHFIPEVFIIVNIVSINYENIRIFKFSVPFQ